MPKNAEQLIVLTVTSHRPSPRSAQVSYFKSSLDTQLLELLWNKYWVNTLACSPLVATRDLATGQIRDIGAP